MPVGHGVMIDDKAGNVPASIETRAWTGHVAG